MISEIIIINLLATVILTGFKIHNNVWLFFFQIEGLHNTPNFLFG